LRSFKNSLEKAMVSLKIIQDCCELSTCTGDYPGVLGTEHFLLESLTEDDTGLIFVKVADDDSYAVLL